MPVFREAAIIVPTIHDGRKDARDRTKSALLNMFGGYTQHATAGAWKEPDGTICYDASDCYTVAVPDVCPALAGKAGLSVRDATAPWLAARTMLRKLAAQVCRDCVQQCVYVRFPCGSVAFIGSDGRDFYGTQG